jgi:hypothetical protein
MQKRRLLASVAHGERHRRSAKQFGKREPFIETAKKDPSPELFRLPTATCHHARVIRRDFGTSLLERDVSQMA